MSRLARRRLLAAAAAAAVAGIDLGVKAGMPTPFHHMRSDTIAAVTAGVAAMLLWVVPRVPSRGVALGAGVAAGGALGNLVSLFAWAEGVPDPLVRGSVAFNLADVGVLGGDGLMLAAAAVFALRNRGRLRVPV